MLNFYDRYINLCASVKKSPSKVAEEIGLSRPAVSSWKTGKAKPSDVTILKIAEYFNVSIDYLLGEAEEPEEIKKDPALDVKTDTENKVSDLGSVALNIIYKLKPEFQEDALAYLLELSAKQRASEGKE